MEVMQPGLELHISVPVLSHLGVIERSGYLPALTSMRVHRVGNRSRSQSDRPEVELLWTRNFETLAGLREAIEAWVKS